MRIQFSEDQLLCGAQVIENGQYVYDEDDYISIQDNQQDLFMDIHKKLIGEKFPEIKYLHLYPELIEQYTDNGLTYMEYECSDLDGEFMGILKGSLATTEIENEFVLELVDFVMN